MKKILSFIFIGCLFSIPQLQSISLAEYIQQHGAPEIDEVAGILDLSNKNLTDLTGLQNIVDKDQVYSLKLSNNRLTRLPEDIFNGFNELRRIDLNNNQLHTLPSTIFNNLYKLSYLYLNNNQLQKLPATLFNNLQNLSFIFLTNNQLQTLLEDIFNNLNDLKFLYLKDNPFKLEFIPQLITMINSIPNLEYLDSVPKDQALRQQPYSMLKGLTVEYIAKNIDAYRDRLYLLPQEILDLLPLTPQQRAAIAAEKRHMN